MNKITILITTLALLSGGTVIATNIIATDHVHDDNSTVSHSGRTNSDGCHNNRKNGTYHCH